MLVSVSASGPSAAGALHRLLTSRDSLLESLFASADLLASALLHITHTLPPHMSSSAESLLAQLRSLVPAGTAAAPPSEANLKQAQDVLRKLKVRIDREENKGGRSC